MYSTEPLLRVMGAHVLPGVLCVSLSSLLLLLWELQRLTRGRSKPGPRRILAGGGIALGIVSLGFIVARFIVVN